MHIAKSVCDALQWLEGKDDIETVFAIGGVSIYAEAMAMAECEALHVTHVRKEFPADRFLPQIDQSKWIQTSSRRRQDAGGIEIDVAVYERASAPPGGVKERHEEEQYLNLIREVCNYFFLSEEMRLHVGDARRDIAQRSHWSRHPLGVWPLHAV